VKTRDAVIGFIVLVVLITGAVLIRNSRKNKLALPLPTLTVEQKVTDKFGGLVIPADVDKADLTDVSGTGGLGIATRKFANGRFELTVLADLPDPRPGVSYKVFLFKDDASIPVGTLRVAKGGYLVDFVSSRDYSDYSKVVVTLENTNVLEGSF